MVQHEAHPLEPHAVAPEKTEERTMTEAEHRQVVLAVELARGRGTQYLGTLW